MGRYDSIKDNGAESSDYDNHKELAGIVSQNNYEFIKAVNKNTSQLLGKQWAENIRANKKYWRKHQPLISAHGLGRNKAVIGIGAGRSFHINKDILGYYALPDGIKDWNDRNFILISSNHQFKPLLEIGIIPDFIVLVDASDVVYDQLCKDIPSTGQHTTLITGVHASPRVVKDWTKQGRHILFYITPETHCLEAFKTHINRDPIKYRMELGGNVMNGAFMIAMAVMQSTVFMAVGNDLSFPVKDSIEEQRKVYYADGDYTSNAKETGTGRDEAASFKKWAGFSLEPRKVFLINENPRGLNRYNISLDVVGTSKTLWVYKTWLEMTILGQLSNATRFHYFNCSESGILGVMAKDDSDDALGDPDNWYMFDEVAINKVTGAGMYHTGMLKDVIQHFLKAKGELQWEQRGKMQNGGYGVPHVGGLVHQPTVDIVKNMISKTA